MDGLRILLGSAWIIFHSLGASLLDSRCFVEAIPSPRESATFVPPAAPSIARSVPAPTKILQDRIEAVRNGYGLYRSMETSLAAKKKTKAGTAQKKIQVKLLHHVAGSGQAGDIIQVTPAFFSNKLKPTKLAEIISDEQIEKERAEREEKERELKSKAIELQSKLSEMSLVIKRKTGPDGKLFGGIGAKVIMEVLQDMLMDDFMKQKFVTVAELMDENGNKLSGDIKQTGSYTARIALSKDISAKVEVNVQHE